MRKIAKFGWKPDLPDFRDLLYSEVHSPKALGAVVAPVDSTQVHNIAAVTGGVSLRAKMPPVFNQGQLGSCTANAGAAMWAFVHGGGPYSRLALYYFERMIEGTIGQDSGGYLRDVIAVLVKNGIGLEAAWPYVEANFTQEPPAVELAEAAQDKATVYSRLQTREDFRQCLDQGFPFIVGISVYSSFETEEVSQTGVIPMPTANDSMVGGHAVCVIGYNDNIHGGAYYEVRNSWGEDWGDEGNFWLPAEYLENQNLASDMWTVRK